MTRKDCESSQLKNAGWHGHARAWSSRTTFTSPAIALLGLLATLTVGTSARADSVRIYATAVVTADQVLITDVCQLRGVEATLAETMNHQLVTDAPVEGGTKIVHMQMIRDALAAGGANMATLIVTGARECTISRPAPSKPKDEPPADIKSKATKTPAPESANVALQAKPTKTPNKTLRQAVTDDFNREYARRGGTIELEFDRTSGAALELAGYEFIVRRKPGPRPELSLVEVDVMQDQNVVQTVAMTVRASLQRQVAVALRAINQGATIRPADVDLRTMTFNRLDAATIGDLSECIGQRAKRFIAENNVIEPAAIEGVPLVTRGQLVTLTSVCGAIRVVSSGRAEREGHLGEMITVRAVDDTKAEYDGVVVGPGKVELVSEPNHVPTRTAERG